MSIYLGKCILLFFALSCTEKVALAQSAPPVSKQDIPAKRVINAGSSWEIVSFENREYVTAESLVWFYRIEESTRDDKSIWLRSPTLIVKGEIGSRYLLINNIKFALRHPLIERDEKVLISRLDLAGLIDPVMRPWLIGKGDKKSPTTVVIDAAHGGMDSGAKGPHGLEKDFTLSLATALRDALKARGVTVVMTRDGDTTMSLSERMKIANSVSDGVYVGLRFNSGSPADSGIETLVPEPDGNIPLPLTLEDYNTTGNIEPAKLGMALATAVHSMTLHTVKLIDRGLNYSRLDELKHLRLPGMVFVAGSLSHDMESKLIASNKYQAIIANAVADGILNYRAALNPKPRSVAGTQVPSEKGEGSQEDEDAAGEVATWKKLAEDGVAAAQILLGDAYSRGVGVAKDAKEAARWFIKAAEQGDATAQHMAGSYYEFGRGVTKSLDEAARWYQRSAAQGYPKAQFKLACCFLKGEGLPQSDQEAAKWFLKAAEQDFAEGQLMLAICFASGTGVEKSSRMAFEWLLKAAEQNHAAAQNELGKYYFNGEGVPKDYREAYKWWLLAGALGNNAAREASSMLEEKMSPELIAEAQALARAFVPRETNDKTKENKVKPEIRKTGTGFFISRDGYLITSLHVIKDSDKIFARTPLGKVPAQVVQSDKTNDFALLKVDGNFDCLRVSSSRGVKLGDTVTSIGYPNILLQGVEPKLSKGDISGLSGIQDDPRHFQISLPVQPGNSGGALVDANGNVVGVVSHKLNQDVAIEVSGSPAENVSYAAKSSFLLGFLESVPDLAAKLQPPFSGEKPFDELVEELQRATVLIIVE